MAQITDPLRQHDWNSEEYVEDWAQRQMRNETLRAKQFALLAGLLPFDREAAFRFMDVGCGYGAPQQVFCWKPSPGPRRCATMARPPWPTWAANA